MLLIPVFILLVTQAVLRPYFPDETHALIDDWAYFTFYFLFFLMGILSFSQSGIWQSIERNKWNFFIASILVAIPFYGFYLHFRNMITLPWGEKAIELAFDIAGIFGSWFWVVTVIAWGQHFLNKPHPWLKHFNEGLYPFYILHQTVIIVLGYYICQLDWGIFVKFWTVALLTLLNCLMIYFLLIRPFPWVRLFFGMKSKKVESVKVLRS